MELEYGKDSRWSCWEDSRHDSSVLHCGEERLVTSGESVVAGCKF